jgi:hypothetical protein
MGRLALGVFFVAFVLGMSRTAYASPTFPDFIRDDLGLAESPPCTDCHIDPNGGYGTATTPFATYLRSRGLRATDTASLRTALAAAAAERHDSNGDGVPDIDELKANRDPNGGSSGNRPPPKYGCGAHIAPLSSSDVRPGFFLVALLALGMFVRRLARSSRTNVSTRG